MDRAERDRKIYSEWLGGAPIRDIAARWGVEKSTVKQIIIRMPSFGVNFPSSAQTVNLYDDARLAPVPQDEKIA